MNATATPPGATPQPAPGGRPTILLVDDDEHFRGFVREVLDGAGYPLLEGHDGEEGSLLYHARKPDLLLTNLLMPHKEGLSLIGEVRDTDQLLPIIAMTGHEGVFGERYQKAARSLGADQVLHKPFTPEELLDAVARAFATHGRDRPGRC